MRTSDGLGHKVLVACAFLVALVGLDVALTLALEPYGSISEVIWRDWRADAQGVDTLVIGSSVAADSLRGEELDAALGSRSFSLASPGQSLHSSYLGLKQAMDERPVRRVILGTSHTALFDNAYGPTDLAITQARVAGLPLPAQARNYLPLLADRRYAGTSTSLGFLAPWLLNHVSYAPSAISANIALRLHSPSANTAHKAVEPGREYLGRGFASVSNVANFSSLDESFVKSIRLEYTTCDGLELQALEDICRLCHDRGVELYVVITPLPDCSLVALSDLYEADMPSVRDLVTSYGATYLDFNLVRGAWYAPEARDFADHLHLNATGAKRFSPALGQTIRAIEAGEDVSGRFWGYADWDVRLSAIDYVSFAYLEAMPGNETSGYAVRVLSGQDLDLEYEVAVHDDDTDAWVVVRPYGTEPLCSLDLGPYEMARIRLSVRRPGASEPELVHQQTVSAQGL